MPGTPKSKVKSRIILTPQHAKRLMKALTENIGKYEASESGIGSLAKTLQAQKKPDGSPVYTPLVAVTLMVFYVFALQCVSTVAVVRRETNSWKWPAFQWLYMGALAWVLAFITYQGGRLLGLA